MSPDLLLELARVHEIDACHTDDDEADHLLAIHNAIVERAIAAESEAA